MPTAITPLAMTVDRALPLIAFAMDTPRLASMTIDIVRLGPSVRIAGVLSAVNGDGGASTSTST